MKNSHTENLLKRFLKRKVKVTLGLVVAFMITGAVGYGADIVIGETAGYEVDEKGEVTRETIVFTSKGESITYDLNGNTLIVEDGLYVGPTSDFPENGSIDIKDNSKTGTFKSYGTIGRDGSINVGNLIVDTKEANGITTGVNGEKLEITANNVDVTSKTSGIFIVDPNGQGAVAELIVKSNDIKVKSGHGIRNNSGTSTLDVEASNKITLEVANYGINGATSGGTTKVTAGELDITLTSNVGQGAIHGMSGANVYVNSGHITTHKFDDGAKAIWSRTGGKVFVNYDEKGNKIEGNHLLELEGDIVVAGESIVKVTSLSMASIRQGSSFSSLVQ